MAPSAQAADVRVRSSRSSPVSAPPLLSLKSYIRQMSDPELASCSQSRRGQIGAAADEESSSASRARPPLDRSRSSRSLPEGLNSLFSVGGRMSYDSTKSGSANSNALSPRMALLPASLISATTSTRRPSSRYESASNSIVKRSIDTVRRSWRWTTMRKSANSPRA